jgi:nicotinamidase-related amidase
MTDLQRRSVKLGHRPALVLVDLIRGFTDPACPLGSNADSVVAVNRALLDCFRAGGLPVFFTTVVYRDPGQARVFRQRVPALDVLQPGSPWVEIDPRLAPRAGEMVIEKRWASGFFGTELAECLEAAGVDSLVVTGLTTSGCVRATAVDGLQHDYAVVVPRDAVGDRNPDAHDANLFDLNAKYADVLSSKEVIQHITEIRDACLAGDTGAAS